jgi:hypothetical protein
MTDIKVVYNSKTLAETDKCVAKSVSSWQDARKFTQIALVSVLIAAYRHGDGETAVKRMNTIVEGAKGGNTKAIVEWGVQMGYKVDEKGTCFASAPDKDTIARLAGDNFKNAKALLWFNLKPIKAFEGYDLDAAVHALIKKANKMQELAANDEDAASKIVIDDRLLAELETLVA